LRKLLIIALGLASLAAFAKEASAESNLQKTCTQMSGSYYSGKTFETCTTIFSGPDGDVYGSTLACPRGGGGTCDTTTVNLTPDAVSQAGGTPAKLDAVSQAGGTPPIKDANSGSKPKQVNGQSQRTADGGTIMVTPEGKEWVWNGKYNMIASYEHDGKILEYRSVMQGDPDAPWRAVNGKNMQVSDPRYMAEADAAAAKKKAEDTAKQATLQKISNQQKKNYINGAKGPGGILGRGGTAVRSESSDGPAWAKKAGASLSASNAGAAVRPSALHPVNAPPAAPQNPKASSTSASAR
jgi:hypothetical protein